MRIRFVTVAVLCGSLGAIAGEAHGQDCSSRQPPNVGVAVGRSAAYFELAAGAVGAGPATSTEVRSGPQLTGRADLPVAGPLRLRLEASTVRWDVRQTTYDIDAGYQPIDDVTIGHMRVRHLVALVGVRGGRAPVCGHVSFGAGLHSLAFQEVSSRRLGFAAAAGVEIPTGEQGVVQIDLGLHVIDLRGESSTARTVALVGNLTVGWAWRF